MAIIDKTPRMTPNQGVMGGEAPAKKELFAKGDAVGMMGMLNDIGIGNFDVEEKTPAEKGDAADTPRQDGPTRQRGESVKNFFKSVGKGIGDFFTRIGNAFSSAIDTIKEAMTARIGGQATAQTPPKELDRQSKALKDLCVQMAEDLEKGYKDYLGHTDDQPPMSRMDFVKEQIPEPQGGADGIDKTSFGYVGDRIDDVRADLTPLPDPGRNEMRNLLMDRLTEFPTLDTASAKLLEDEVKTALNSDVTTFLRTDSSYTKLANFTGHNAIPFESVAKDLLASVKSDFVANSHLASVDGMTIRMSALTTEQGTVIHDIADQVLGKLFDVDFEGPERDEQKPYMPSSAPKSFLNQIPQDFRDELAEKAETILSSNEGTPEDRAAAVKTLYVSSLFLRGMNGDMNRVFVTGLEKPGEQSLAVQTQQMMQTFFNGVTVMSKGNDVAKGVLTSLVEKYQTPLNDFLLVVGMPTAALDYRSDDMKTLSE